jgi:hypothetical protein
MKKLLFALSLISIFFLSCSNENIKSGGDYQFENSVLQSIEVTSLPVKIVYSVGEDFEPDGLVLTANYIDYFANGDERQSTRTIKYSIYKDTITFSETDFSTVGKKEITVTYEGKSASFNVTVQ